MSNFSLQKYNFRNFMGAVNIRINDSIPVPTTYIDELSAGGSQNIYLTNAHFNFFLIPEDECDTVYMNENISGIARELTALKHTDFLKSSICNYTYVNNMHTAYANCFKLKGSPKSGNSVKSMYGTYFNDHNLTGSYKIGKLVNNLIGTYYNCYNLTDLQILNTNATMMVSTFYNCTNLIGSPVDADWAKSLKDCYYNCILLEGKPANCNNAFITINSYYNCPNLYGTFYWLYNNSSQADTVNMTNMFFNRNLANKLNIFVYNQSGILNALLNNGDSYGNIYGLQSPISWTQMTTIEGFKYYNNSATNTNIFVEEDLAKNIDFDYTGTIQTFVVPTTGIWRLETWGAQGNSVALDTMSARGGYGSYSTGEIRLNRGDVLYIGVGGQDGYNGGGNTAFWDGSEIDIVWSGNYNKLTVAIENGEIIFRMYTNNTLIYTFSSYIGDSAYDLENINVGFIIHEGDLIAKPSFIYDNGDTTFSYNQEEPTQSEMTAIYNWLLGTAPSWDGSEIDIAWSGNNNKITVQMNNNHIVFKMYISNTEIYSFTSTIGSTTADIEYINVSYIVDDTLQIAKPSFIYDNGDNTYSYNQESPTQSEMENIYTWLSAGRSNGGNN